VGFFEQTEYNNLVMSLKSFAVDCNIYFGKLCDCLGSEGCKKCSGCFCRSGCMYCAKCSNCSCRTKYNCCIKYCDKCWDIFVYVYCKILDIILHPIFCCILFIILLCGFGYWFITSIIDHDLLSALSSVPLLIPLIICGCCIVFCCCQGGGGGGSGGSSGGDTYLLVKV